jgi:hypothetical protein
MGPNKLNGFKCEFIRPARLSPDLCERTTSYLGDIPRGKKAAGTAKLNADPEERPQTGEPDRLSNMLIEHVKAMTDNTPKSIKWMDIKK